MKKLSFFLIASFCLCGFVAKSQNVGIGTTTPTQKLEVAGNTYVRDSVGIGVANPEYKLDVGGRMRLRSEGTIFGTAGVWFNNSSNSSTPVFLGMADNNVIGMYGSGLGTFGLTMNSVNGNVGIGNTYPTNKLEVAGNILAVGNIATTGNVGIDGSVRIGSIGMDIGMDINPLYTNFEKYKLYAARKELIINGNGKATLFGYRSRNTVKYDGANYSKDGANAATAGFNFWGDLYSFAVAGWNYNDYSRCGGTFGADINGLYWGSLGYRSSGLLNYGVYGSAAYSSGAGRIPNGNTRGGSDYQGIGGGFYGGMIGSWSRGDVMGQVNSGEMFASYNVGNVYTSGHTADLVSNGTKKVAAYSVTSPQLKVYDDGAGQINGGEVYVPFNEDYKSLLGTTPNVTISAVGSPAQLYIKSINKNGFTVAAATGEANAQFSWIAIGNRTDAAATKQNPIPVEITDIQFDEKMKAVMFNEGNKEASGTPIWYDGQKIRFDKAPEMPKEPKVDLSPVVKK